MISAFPEEKQLWSEDFYMERGQLSNLSKRIARRISEEIDITLTPGEVKRLAESKPIDPAAYEAYLRGMSYWELGKKSDLDKAMSYFKLSLEIDPNYALAHLGIARTWAGYAQHGFLPHKEVVEQADVARKKAFELDSTLVEIRAGMATRLTWGDWNWKEAEKEFLRAIEINANYEERRGS